MCRYVWGDLQTEVLCNLQLKKVKKFSVGEMAELLEHEI